jgi:hypothetical protein
MSGRSPHIGLDICGDPWAVWALTMAHVQQRDGRWCIVDRYGKHGRVRTIPVPTCATGATYRKGFHGSRSNAISTHPTFILD